MVKDTCLFPIAAQSHVLQDLEGCRRQQRLRRSRTATVTENHHAMRSRLWMTSVAVRACFSGRRGALRVLTQKQ
jgi:hypothetical protein